MATSKVESMVKNERNYHLPAENMFSASRHMLMNAIKLSEFCCSILCEFDEFLPDTKLPNALKLLSDSLQLAHLYSEVNKKISVDAMRALVTALVIS